MSGLKDLAFLLIVTLLFWKHLIEGFLFFHDWGTMFDELNISWDVFPTLDEAFDTGDELLDVFKVVFEVSIIPLSGLVFLT